jgi:hypothetical protein
LVAIGHNNAMRNTEKYEDKNTFVLCKNKEIFKREKNTRQRAQMQIAKSTEENEIK